MADILDIDKIKTLLEDFAEKRDWQKFHHPKNLAMALAGEAGELLEIFQWMSDAESKQAGEQTAIKEKTGEELADIMLYLIRMASLMNINLSEAILNKLALNRKYLR